MTTEDFISALFYRVGESMKDRFGRKVEMKTSKIIP
jgi:hypothetical protein